MACSFTSVKSLLKYFCLNEGHPDECGETPVFFFQPPLHKLSLNCFILFFVYQYMYHFLKYMTYLRLFTVALSTACAQLSIPLASPVIRALAAVIGSLRALTSFMQLQTDRASAWTHILTPCLSTSLILQTAFGNPLDTTLV